MWAALRELLHSSEYGRRRTGLVSGNEDDLVDIILLAEPETVDSCHCIVAERLGPDAAP